LDNLYAGSEYEVIVKLNQPPGFKKVHAEQKFKTKDQSPTGAPNGLNVNRQDTELGFNWKPPKCLERNGEISQYEYELIGLEDRNQLTRKGTKEGSVTSVAIRELRPGSLYRFHARAYTSAGYGPWSEDFDVRTSGNKF